MNRRAPALLALVVAACASSTEVGHRVDAEFVDVFPPEGRRWTYEAENEVIIAIDRQNGALDAIDEAEARLAEQEAKVEASGPAVLVEQARMAWLEVIVSQREAALKAAELGVRCAKANFELTKAKLAIRFDLPVEEGYVEPFETQFSDCAEALDEQTQEAEKLASRAVAAKDEWRRVRTEYVRSSGDHNAGLWID